MAFSRVFSDCLRSSKCFYTDGSKMSDSTYVGFAFVCQDGEPRPFRSVGYWSSIFTAEAMAIVERLCLIFLRFEGMTSRTFRTHIAFLQLLSLFRTYRVKLT